MQVAARPNQPKGFTLNELLVSMAILGVLSALLIANFSRGRLSDDLRISSQTLASNLRRVQNLATVGQTLASGKVPPGGYGVAIEWVPSQKAYAVFADIGYVDGSCLLSNPSNANKEYDGPSCDELAEGGVVQFRADVVFERAQIDSGSFFTFGVDPRGDDDSYFDIGFKPPKPIPVLDGAAGHTIKIELRHMKSDQYRTITIIGPSGQISERSGRIQ